MKIVIVIFIMLHYEIAYLKAQIPYSRSLDYIRDYYDQNRPNNEGMEESYPEEEYGDESQSNDQDAEFWEGLLKLLKKKFPQFKPDHQKKDFPSSTGKGPAMYNENMNKPRDHQQKRYPDGYKMPKNPYQPQGPNNNNPSMGYPGHNNNPYQSHNNQQMGGGTCKKLEKCMKRCNGEHRCMENCKMRQSC